MRSSLLATSFRLLALTALCSSFLAGCSSSAKELNPDPETKEIVAKKDVDIDSPEAILFESAKTSFQNQLYSVAKDQFTALMSNFPHGPLAEYAELKVADCSFFIRDYDVSAPQYEGYAKEHPGSLSAAYALLMAARSYHLSSKGIGHDAHALERAQETYGKLLEQYPESVYAKQAAAYQRSAIHDLTANERAVADFYKKRGQEEAYHARMKAIEEKWQPLAKNVQKSFDARQDQVEGNSKDKESVVTELAETTVPDALEADKEEAKASAEEGTPETEETPENTDIQETESIEPIAEPSEESEGDTSDSEEESDTDSFEDEDTETPEEYKDAVPIPEPIVDEPAETPEDVEQEEEETAEELSADGGEVAEKEHEEDAPEESASHEGEIRKVPPAPVAEPTPEISTTTGEVKLVAPSPRLEIIQVGCAAGEVILYLNQPWVDRGFLARNRKIIPHDGIISTTLPLTRGTGKTYNCFEKGDLIVSSNGTVTIAYDQPMFVQAQKEPPQVRFSAANSN